MTTVNGKCVAVFFTHGVSLALWDRRGMFSREALFFKQLAERTGEVMFFTYGMRDAEYQERLGPHIRLLPKCLPVPNSIYGFMLPFVYWKYIKQADVVRTHQMAGIIPALIAHWLLRKPLIVRCGYQWSQFLKQEAAPRVKRLLVFLIEHLAYHSAASIIVTTASDAEYVVKKYHISQNKIQVIPNYVDTDLFRPIDAPKERGRVCFVGRLEKQKNLSNLVAAMEGLQAHLLLVGDGSEKGLLESVARKKNVKLSIQAPMPHHKIPDLLGTCEIFVLPSWYEGNPKVLLEAMACGLPVIGANVSGIKEIIRHQQNGYVSETDADSLKKGLLTLLADKKLQQDLGREARTFIVQNFTLEHILKKEISVLYDL